MLKLIESLEHTLIYAAQAAPKTYRAKLDHLVAYVNDKRRIQGHQPG
jgi:hypothetical protein